MRQDVNISGYVKNSWEPFVKFVYAVLDLGAAGASFESTVKGTAHVIGTEKVKVFQEDNVKQRYG